MSGGDEELLSMLRQALVNLGSDQRQAGVMADQLLKRARQLATERDISEAEAMAGLLKKVIEGRRGTYTGDEPEGQP